MFLKPNKTNDSKFSVINSIYRTSNDTGVIGVYGLPNKRYIYIESGSNETRQITVYSAKIPAFLYGSDMIGFWHVIQYPNEDLHEVANEIRVLRKRAHTCMEIQVTQSEFNVFEAELKSTLNDISGTLGGRTDEEDEKIQNALAKIGASITFASDSTCVMS